MFNSHSINTPLVKALTEVLAYANSIKEFMTNKRTLECETIEVSHNCIAILRKNLVTQKEDCRAFKILYTIGACMFGRALFNMGANVNLMPWLCLNSWI